VEPAGEVCIANIGFAQRRQRHRLGVASLVSAAALSAVAISLALPAAWLALVGFFVFGGFAGIVQAREKT
jgi:uncharacterized membrane protein YdjX (TVP38/TMEM64 family)